MDHKRMRYWLWFMLPFAMPVAALIWVNYLLWQQVGLLDARIAVWDRYEASRIHVDGR